MMVDFDSTLSLMVLQGGITQTIIPFNDETMDIRKGDVCDISFARIPFKDYKLLVEGTSVTSIQKLSNQDLSKNGFIYRPFFEKFMMQRGIQCDDTVIKVDFKVVE